MSKKKKETVYTGGRRRAEINWKQFEGMCQIHCTKLEIASILDVDDEVLEREVQKKYKQNFAKVWQRFASQGKMSLRRKQMKRAIEDEDVTMLKWMGQQLLGQSPSLEIKVEKTPTEELMIEARELIKELENDSNKSNDDQ